MIYRIDKDKSVVRALFASSTAFESPGKTHRSWIALQQEWKVLNSFVTDPGAG